jgi:hypothetical protein
MPTKLIPIVLVMGSKLEASMHLYYIAPSSRDWDWDWDWDWNWNRNRAWRGAPGRNNQTMCEKREGSHGLTCIAAFPFPDSTSNLSIDL